MRVGIFRTSHKENERRAPIFPEHLHAFPRALRSQFVFESGYGDDFGFSEQHFIAAGCRVAKRVELLRHCDLLVLPKPMPEDMQEMTQGQVLFGWVHCVQQRAVTQVAIDRRLTLIAWEAMHHWSTTGERLMHIFHKNNEIAGYSAVLHALQCLGIDGYYGPRRKVVVLGYGSVSRGAIYALQGRGFNNIHVFSRRQAHLIRDQNPDVYFGHYYADEGGTLIAKAPEEEDLLLSEVLSDADIICNGVLQDPRNPLIFLSEEDVHQLKPRSLIIDISCDLGMGFTFARPTTFEAPVFQIGGGSTYYSVDHTPSYLWAAASREISKALLPFLGVVAAGPTAWADNRTILSAIEIREGVIQNANILSFQNRQSDYPHRIHPD